jgi:hypothetical protein
MHKLLLILAGLAMLVASCGTQEIPTIGEVDWCYTFDFRTNDDDYGIQFINGSWEAGKGLVPNASGVLRANYAQTATVQPAIVIVQVDRGEGVTGDVDVAVNALVFGVPISIDETIPSAVSEIPPQAATPEDSALSGSVMQVSMVVSDVLYIRSIEIRGYGSNPFDSNECDQPADDTPTAPVADTPTSPPTDTPVATYTLPPSNTPDVTPSPQVCVPPGQPTPTAGPTNTATAGPSPTPQTFMFTDDFNGDLPFGVTRTLGVTGPMNGGSISIWSSGLEGWNTSTDYPSSVSSKWYNPGPATVYHDVFYTFPANVVVTAVRFDVMAIGYGSGGYTAYAAAYQEGLALDPAHPTGYIAGNQGASGAGHEYVWETKTFPHTGYLLRTVEVRLASTRGASWSLNAIDNVEIYFKWVTPPATTPTPWPECTTTPTVTSTMTSSVVPTHTPTPSRTPVTRTPTATPTVTRTPIVVASPTRTNTPIATATPGPPIPTSVPTSTASPVPAPTISVTQPPTGPGPGDGEGGGEGDWESCEERPEQPGWLDVAGNIRYAIGVGTQIITCIVVPYLAAGVDIVGNLFSWGVNVVLDFVGFIGSAFAWAGGTLSNFGIQIGNFFQGIIGLIEFIFAIVNSILAIIGLVWAIFVRLLELMIGWIGQFMSTASTVVNAWWSATPTPIPFLPHCVSNPLDSNICAFWYLLDNTLLGGTLGDLIVTLFVVLLDLMIVLEFIVMAMNILREGDGAKK